MKKPMESKRVFNCYVEIYQERQPDHYEGADVGITITSNSKGKGTAKMIQQFIEDIDSGKVRIVKNDI